MKSYLMTVFSVKNNKAKFFLILCSLSIALLCLWVSYLSYSEVQATKTWDKVTATVISTSVETVASRKGVAYCPKVIVSVERAGALYNSELKISQYPCELIKQSVERVASAFSVGKVLEVLVNPARSNEVKLATYSIGWVFYLTIIVAAVMLVMFFGLLFTPANSRQSRVSSN